MKYLVHDIETIPTSEIAELWVPSEKDKERHPERDPFPPIWCHRVVCIGMLALDKNLIPHKGGLAANGAAGGKSEKEMIERWSIAASGKMFNGHALKLVDYNGRGFDVPVLQTRAFRYGVQLPFYFQRLPDNKGEISRFSKEYRDRYGGWHLDIQELWTNKNAFRYPSLEHLARLMGLPGKNGFDGSKVYDAYKEERFEEIDTYCMQDVYQTAFIFMRFKYLAGKISLEAYREAADALCNWIQNVPQQKEFFAQIDRAALLLEQE